MKQCFSIFLSILLLVSSTGITYAQHFCGEYEMMAKLTLGEEAMSCGMVMDDSCGDQEDKENHSCCDNIYTSIDTDDNFASSSFDVQLSPVVAISMVSVFVVVAQKVEDVADTVYVDYSPPPRGEDLQVLYETFLI